MRRMLPFHKFEEQERDAVFTFMNNLSQLESYAQRFHAAVELLEHSAHLTHHDRNEAMASESMESPEWARLHMHSEWMHCAAEWAAMQVFHFEKVLNLIVSVRSFHNLRSFSSHISKQKLTALVRSFKQAFPDHDRARYAAAHRAEAAQKADKHAVRDGMTNPGISAAPGTPVFIGGGLIGDVYTTTVDGKEIRLTINHESTTKLYELVEATHAVFDDVHIALEGVNGEETPQPKAGA